jgi:hypothetical protein
MNMALLPQPSPPWISDRTCDWRLRPTPPTAALAYSLSYRLHRSRLTPLPLGLDPTYAPARPNPSSTAPAMGAARAGCNAMSVRRAPEVFDACDAALRRASRAGAQHTRGSADRLPSGTARTSAALRRAR